jgi:hypothetical protein
VWHFLITVVFLIPFPVVCPLKYLHIERHLAAKFGTNFAIYDMSSLLVDELILGWCCFSCSFWYVLFSSYRDD